MVQMQSPALQKLKKSWRSLLESMAGCRQTALCTLQAMLQLC